MRAGPLLHAICVPMIAFGTMGTTARSQAQEHTMTTSQVQIPESVRAEHGEIHSTLVEATRAPGRVGVAARALAQVLEPHFEREEQIALPPLGLLAPLAAGERPPGAEAILAMSDTLRRELPRMLEEHTRIRAAVENLRRAAHAAHSPRYERLAGQLELHAQTEEQVLYPAAILVGDLIRLRQKGD